jgi:hypothetical protein
MNQSTFQEAGPEQAVIDDRVIITGASQSYGTSLLALIGSLNCNWPDHPRIVVYDLGMSDTDLNQLATAQIEVRKVPEFCPHWRSDFTWKPWCFRDAPGRSYLWLDAGTCILRPMDEAFRAIEQLGYFAVALYNHPIAPSVPEPLRKNLGLTSRDMEPMISISSGIHGFLKEGPGARLVEQAYQLALVRENMQATAPPHRHDQALLTLLLHQYFGPPVLADYHIYAHHFPTGPGNESRQKVWVHRRKMLEADLQHFIACLNRRGESHRPVGRIAGATPPGVIQRLRIAIAKLRGRFPGHDYVDLDQTVLHGMK